MVLPLSTFERYEYKYQLNHLQYRQLHTLIRDRLSPDEHQVSEAGYVVDSLYFDTLDHRSFWDKEGSIENRYKVRLRRYQSESKIFLEIKEKRNEDISKYRVALPGMNDQLVDENFLNQIPGIPDKISHKVSVALFHPELSIRYLRQAFISDHFTKLRVTFDYDLEAIQLNSECTTTNAFTGLSLPFQSPDEQKIIIMEIKFSTLLPVWLLQILQEYNLQRQSYSKYFMAHQTLQQYNLPVCDYQSFY